MGTGRGWDAGTIAWLSSSAIPTTTTAELPELVLLAGRHSDVVQHRQAHQAVHSEAAVVGHECQRVSLQHQKPQVLECAEAGHHAL